jgi:hypothetical protein
MSWARCGEHVGSRLGTLMGRYGCAITPGTLFSTLIDSKQCPRYGDNSADYRDPSGPAR